MIFVFVRGIGNFGSNRFKSPEFVRCSFGHTGNYVLEEAKIDELEKWAESLELWYVRLELSEMEKVIKAGSSEQARLERSGYTGERWPRFVTPVEGSRPIDNAMGLLVFRQ